METEETDGTRRGGEDAEKSGTDNDSDSDNENAETKKVKQESDSSDDNSDDDEDDDKEKAKIFGASDSDSSNSDWKFFFFCKFLCKKFIILNEILLPIELSLCDIWHPTHTHICTRIFIHVTF